MILSMISGYKKTAIFAFPILALLFPKGTNPLIVRWFPFRGLRGVRWILKFFIVFLVPLIKQVKFIVSFILLYFGCISLQSQDIHFSQFYAIPLYLSPSFAGSIDGSRVVVNYRNQWPEIPKAFVTYAISYDQYIPKINTGIGLIIIHDQMGELNYGTTSIGGIYTYNFRVYRNWQVRPGLELKYSYATMNIADMVTRDMLLLNTSTPMESIQREHNGYFDANFSTLMFNEILWFGTTISHLMKPNYTIGLQKRMPIRINFYSGIKFIRKGRLIKPRPEHIFIAFNYRQMAYFNQLDLGLLGYKKGFNLGLWYSGMPFSSDKYNTNAIIVSIGYDDKGYTIGMSYDITVSGLRKFTNGAIEISYAYVFPKRDIPKKTRTMIPCPVF